MSRASPSVRCDSMKYLLLHQYRVCVHAEPAGAFQSAFGAPQMGGAGFGQNQQMGFGATPPQPAAASFGGGSPTGSFSNSRSKWTQGGSKVDRDQLWEEFKQQPSNFWDNRNKKLNPKAPDFKHKQSGEGLWVSSSPAWFNVSDHPPYGTPPSTSGCMPSHVHTCLHL